MLPKFAGVPAIVGLVIMLGSVAAAAEAQTLNPCIGKKITCAATLASALDSVSPAPR